MQAVVALQDTLERGTTSSLPGGPQTSAVVVILAVLALNIVLVIAALKGFKLGGGVKLWLQDFPSHNATVALAIVLIFETGLVVLIRLALGLVFPDNYEIWVYSLVGLAGVNAFGLVGKRFTDDRYVEAKARGKSIAAATVAAAGASGVNVEGNANITSERSVATAAPADPHWSKMPAGDPVAAEVKAGLDAIAVAQRHGLDTDERG